MKDGGVSHGFTLARWVGLAMVLPALIAVALLGKDTLMMVERIDEAALKSDAAAIDRGLKVLGELNGADVLSRSMQSSAFHHVVVARQLDWMRATFGPGALSAEGVQQLFIVGPTGHVVFSSVSDGAPPPKRAAALLAAAAQPIARAREIYDLVRDAAAGSAPQRGNSSSERLYADDIAKIDGVPAMITVAPFMPEAAADAMPGSPTLLVGVQPMTGNLLAKLGTLSHTKGLRHVSKLEVRRAGVDAHAIRDSQGHVVSYVTWDFSPPGYAILKAALPAIAISLALIAALTLLAAVTMRRMTHKLAKSEQAALYSARHDTVTGLANRGWFMRVFEDVLAPADKDDASTYAVLLIDCDHFKTINDTLGHAAGDAVLSAIARRLDALGDKITIAARLGGDEFAIVTAPLASPDDAMQSVWDIHTTLTASVLFENYVIMVGVSIGAAVIETPSPLTIDTWLARADMALYRAKRDGRGCARIYDHASDTGVLPLVPAARQPADAPVKKSEVAA